MQQKILEFIVDDQFIRAPHYTVVADSKDYLVARFTFSEQWQGLVKTAVFQGADGKAYFVVLDKDTCPIPAEVIQPTRFLVSVFGGDRLTADRAMVEVAASGFTAGGVTPPKPTPDVYNQLMEAVSTDRQLAQAAATTAAEKAEQCVYLTSSAESLLQEAENVPLLAAAAKDAAQRAKTYATTAEDKAKQAENAAAAAQAEAANASAHANAAFSFSEDAREAAEEANTHKSETKTAAVTATDAAQAAQAAAKEAVDALQSVTNEWRLIQAVNVTEPTEGVSCSFAGMGLKEVYFEGTVYSQDRATVLQNFSVGITRTTTIWSGNGTFGNPSYPKTLVRGHLFLSPSGTLVCNATVSLYGYALDGNGKSFTTTGRFGESALTGATAISALYLKVAGGFAENTSFKFWGK